MHLQQINIKMSNENLNSFNHLEFQYLTEQKILQMHNMPNWMETNSQVLCNMTLKSK